MLDRIVSKEPAFQTDPMLTQLLTTVLLLHVLQEPNVSMESASPWVTFTTYEFT